MKSRDYLLASVAAVACALILKLFVIGVVYIPSHSMEQSLLPGDYVLVDKLVYGERSFADVPFSPASFIHLPGFRPVERGDVVVFELPRIHGFDGYEPHSLFVKRCIALSGDRIAVEGKTLSVNGTETFRWRPFSRDQFLAHVQSPLTIPREGDKLTLTGTTINQWIDLIRREGNRVDTSDGMIRINGKTANSYTVRKNYLFVAGDNTDYTYDSSSWGLLPEDNLVGKAEIVYWSTRNRGASSRWYDILSSIRWGRIGTFVR